MSLIYKWLQIWLIIQCLTTNIFGQKCDPTIDYNQIRNDIVELLGNRTDNQLFLLGSQHDHLENTGVIEFMIFEELNKKYKQVHLINEFCFSKSFLINNYLQTGDSTIFKTKYRIADWYREYIQSLKSIYDNSEYKFEIIGVDIDYNFTFETQLALRDLCHKAGVYQTDIKYTDAFNTFLSLINVVRELKNVRRCSRKRLYKVSKILMEEEQEYYQQLFGKDYSIVVQIIQDLHLGFELRKDYIGQTRENIITERLKEILINNPNFKYFAVYGNGHVNKSLDKKRFTSFATQLHSDGFKVFSGYRLYSYNKKEKDMSFKAFSDWIHFLYNISDTDSLNFLKEYFQKDINLIIKSPEPYIEGVDFILFLNRPIPYLSD